MVALGASLHSVLTRLKAEPTRFPQLELLYSREQPVHEPVTVNLPANGLRLRFDGAQQRLRLIEVIDFTRNHITFNDRDLVRPGSAAPAAGDAGGPSFKHIYHKLLGPTYAGEYIPPNGEDGSDTGVYVLSYPGVAFTFKLPASRYSPDKDVVSLLSASPNQTATSMAVFDGPSWAEARQTLWTAILPSIKSNPALPRTKDVSPDEISLVKIWGGGKLQLFRKWTNSSTWISLGETTPQELVIELGPPDAIYRKNDKRMTIHKLRHAVGGGDPGETGGRPDDLTDTDQSSLMTGSEDTNDEDVVEEEASGSVSGECFYNYFYQGFDILVSTPVPPSKRPPGEQGKGIIPESHTKGTNSDRLVATKLVLHGNIPGSYEFNRHRRCPWDIAYLEDGANDTPSPNSETKFTDIEESLNERWRPLYPTGEGENHQRGMVLNRGWGDSPGSSCELLGGWEDSSATAAANLPKGADGSDDSTTTLYGFPGLVFEVLRNGYVNTVTVF